MRETLQDELAHFVADAHALVEKPQNATFSSSLPAWTRPFN